MIATQVKKNLVLVAFDNTEVVTSQDVAVFTIHLSESVVDLDVSLVIDAYDLDNPVHPTGHLGWWQFPIQAETLIVHGKLEWNQQRIAISLDGIPPTNLALSDTIVPAKRLQLVAVLRSNTSNAIIYMDKIPVFQSVIDHLHYRNALSFDLNTSCLAKIWFMPDVTSTVRIICSNIFVKDAVGNFCLDIYHLCLQNQIPVALYAEYYDLAFNTIVRREGRVLFEAGANDTILYFHSTYDPLLEEITQLKVRKKIAYFHGITKPGYLRVFNFELSAVCEKAYEQLPLLSAFDILAANSKATANVLATYIKNVSVDAVTVIFPRLIAGMPTTLRTQRQGNNRLLYVGRFKSHKKIDDLLILFASYLTIDPDAELWLVGGQGDKAYMDFLAWTAGHYLGSQQHKVRWFGQVSDAELQEIYRTASAYVSMSVDEGFCVPLLEAMLAGLPVFAYGINAVREVLGEAGIYFTQKDFSVLAVWINTLLKDDVYVQTLVERQYARAHALLADMDGRAILRLFEYVPDTLQQVMYELS